MARRWTKQSALQTHRHGVHARRGQARRMGGRVAWGRRRVQEDCGGRREQGEGGREGERMLGRQRAPVEEGSVEGGKVDEGNE